MLPEGLTRELNPWIALAILHQMYVVGQEHPGPEIVQTQFPFGEAQGADNHGSHSGVPQPAWAGAGRVQFAVDSDDGNGRPCGSALDFGP